MPALTQTQADAICALSGTGYPINSINLPAGLTAAITAACNECPYTLLGGYLGFADGLQIYIGYMIAKDASGGTYVGDSSSSDPILAFAGRVIELY